jgi:hypothetical protein
VTANKKPRARTSTVETATMTHHTIISTLAALLTLTACQLDLKNIGTPDTTEASSTGTTDSASTTDSAGTTGTTDATTFDPTTPTNATTGVTDTTDATTLDPTTPTNATTTDGTTVGPDPDYVRDCQPDDFICDDWGCEWGPAVVLGQCYKRCTPTEIGEPAPECDEPERPFCSQIGHAFGGDFDCNGCEHICISEPANVCHQEIAACE